MRAAIHGPADQLRKRAPDAEACLRPAHSRPSLSGEEQVAGETLARGLAAFSSDAPMRARIADDARLPGVPQH
jgi:hypothetical protein